MKIVDNSRTFIKTSGISFGTSGARGLVKDFTSAICAAFTVSFLEVMKKSFSFNKVALAIDNRPSSYLMVQACAAALNSKGIDYIYYGVIPTPALAYQSMLEKIPAIMVTGSHIAFDRNGLKFYRPDGEITKEDELAILNAEVSCDCLNPCELTVSDVAGKNYIERYTSLFPVPFLTNKRIGIYEHTSAGRDLYKTLFMTLGAEVVSLGRSDTFVPIDTEAVSQVDVDRAKKWTEEFHLDAIFSTDGDGDRPLVSDEEGNWLRGDMLGLLAAIALSADAVVIPVSCNSIIATHSFFKHAELTKIGSPYIINVFARLLKEYKRVVGFEANGGFLLASEVLINDRPLLALPTRDAVLPVIMLLYSGRDSGVRSLIDILPARYTYSDRLQNISYEKSQYIINIGLLNPQQLLNYIGLGSYRILSQDTTDGLRLTMNNGSIIHLRPSGNAPELRFYAEANSPDEAKKIVDFSLNSLKSKK